MADIDELTIRAALRDELSGPLDELRDAIRRTGDETEKTERKSNAGARGFDRMAAGAGGLAKVAGRTLVGALKTAAVTAGALSVATGVLGVKLLGMASDFAESASKFDTVFAGVSGNVAGYVDDMVGKFGLVKRDVLDAASNFGVFGKAAGIPKKNLGAFSKQLVSAGSDLASFYNADQGDVFLALQSGLSGEAEPLRQFGIFMSDATMKVAAAQLGLNGELTEGQKVMVRQKIIMESLGDAQGDLERTSGGLANQMRSVQGRVKNAGTAIGGFFLPYALTAVSALNGRLGPAVNRLIDRLPLLSEAFANGDIKGAAGILDNIVGAGGRLIPVVEQIATAVNTVPDLASAIAGGNAGGVAAAIDAMLGGGGDLTGPITTALQGAADIGRDLAAVLTGALLPALGDIAGAIDPGWITPLGAARAALGFAADHTTALRTALVLLVAYLTVAKAASVGYGAGLAISSAATTVWAVATGFASGALSGTAVAAGASTAAMTANRIGLALNTVATYAQGTAQLALNLSLYAAGWALQTARMLAYNAALLGVRVATAAFAGAQLALNVALLGAGWAARAAGLLLYNGVMLAARIATAAWAAGQVLLNIALSANPVGLVVLAIGLLIAGLVLAYKKSDTFRGVVNLLWTGIKIAAGAVADFGKAIGRWIIDKIGGAISKVKELASAIRNSPIGKGLAAVGGAVGIGDTATSRARGGGLASTMAGHSAAMGVSGARPRISNVLTGGGGRGKGSGDHQAGRALDLVGNGLGRYASAIRGAGGYAAMHGAGASRHLHAVPAMGDTATSMTRRASPRGAGPSSGGAVAPVVIGPGAIVVHASNDVDLERGVAAGIASYVRDQRERAA